MTGRAVGIVAVVGCFTAAALGALVVGYRRADELLTVAIQEDVRPWD